MGDFDLRFFIRVDGGERSSGWSIVGSEGAVMYGRVGTNPKIERAIDRRP
jgi:hypothetical protein